ncbi:type II CRISPR RNA-guided endonuclease Cas9 [Gemella sp. GL1.1]|nr:type II CRISPR RNA-guided endonuclease Cas9 [Gemella sp. GL1.1]NYS27196.1 type II CRISPR RNA-guided endonuclease Cas9 [Gemella sp. GL1]
MVKEKSYSIGLDIGTSSVGWAVLDQDNKLISKRFTVRGNTDKKSIKKNLIGTLLFDSANTAEDRRINRTAKRRLERRRKRIIWLQELFLKEMSKVDENFFVRLNESFYVPKDKKYDKYPIFQTKKEEVEYYKKYPTIYHLRDDLVNSKEKKDLRLVYLALVHIIKYRGHFLLEGDIDLDSSSVNETFVNFINEYNSVFSERDDFKSIELAQVVDVEAILKEKLSSTRKQEKIVATLSLNKKNDKLLISFLKLITGLEVNFKTDFSLEEDFKFKIASDEYDMKLEELLGKIGDEYSDLFALAKSVHDGGILSNIISGANKKSKAKVSSAMIDRYNTHKNDLRLLKKFFRKNFEEIYVEYFKDESKNGYAAYINGKISELEFQAYTKKFLQKSESADYFLTKIEQGDFLRKQRTYDNGVIPHQLHHKELETILKNQSKHYPFLETEFDKIKKLHTFRIPYYVGPLAQKDNKGNFAWIERKSDEKIRPWNFEKVVDTTASAEKFITRMTSFCQYLPEEKVLPKKSLIYEKYMVFNELTKVKYERDGRVNNLTSKQKSEIFNNIFKQKVKVKEKDIENFLLSEYNLDDIKIIGLDNGKFNSSFATYHDLRKIESLANIIDNAEYEEVIEDIIKTLTVFEDSSIIKSQLDKYKSLISDKDINTLSKKKYTGWGRLSKKLLVGLYDRESGKNILDFLIDNQPDNRNLMQLINSDDLDFKNEITKNQKLEYQKNFSEIVAKLPGSPAIKKGILNALKIVEEIIQVMGGQAPKDIVIEMAREVQNSSNRAPQRLEKLKKGIDELGSDILKEYPVTNAELQKEKLYLYYLQNAKDMYTGDPIDYNDFNSYDIDHIIPQSYIKDNSIDNKVLTSSKENRGKTDDVPSKEVVTRMKSTWERLQKAGLISERKFLNLTKTERGGISKEDKEGFINRQLVETRQITKYVASILDNKFNSAHYKDKSNDRLVNIITLKSEMISRFRRSFGFYKVRSLNDFHHAHDAYLAVLVASSLLTAYPKLKSRLLYGDYNAYRSYGRNKADYERKFLDNILKFFEIDPKKEAISEGKKYNISFNKYVEKVLYNSQINIVKKVEKQKGSFSKETILSAGDSDKLIARKTRDFYLSPSKYGGVNTPVIAYTLALVGYKKDKSKNLVKELLGISVMDRTKFEKNPIEYLKDRGYSEIKEYIILPKYSLFELDNGRRRMLASSKELQKGNQFRLNKDLVELLYLSENYSRISDKAVLEKVEKSRNMYEDLLEEVIKFENKNILADTNMEKIKTTFEKNKDGDISLYAESFANLLKLTSMGAPSAFKFFGESIGRRRYTTTKDIKECLGATLINQSITGLYETRIDMSKLGEDK